MTSNYHVVKELDSHHKHVRYHVVKVDGYQKGIMWDAWVRHGVIDRHTFKTIFMVNGNRLLGGRDSVEEVRAEHELLRQTKVEAAQVVMRRVADDFDALLDAATWYASPEEFFEAVGYDRKTKRYV